MAIFYSVAIVSLRCSTHFVVCKLSRLTSLFSCYNTFHKTCHNQLSARSFLTFNLLIVVSGSNIWQMCVCCLCQSCTEFQIVNTSQFVQFLCERYVVMVSQNISPVFGLVHLYLGHRGFGPFGVLKSCTLISVLLTRARPHSRQRNDTLCLSPCFSLFIYCVCRRDVNDSSINRC